MYDFPGKNFTRGEVVLLSGLTLKQVRILSKDLIFPSYKEPLRYTYDQIIAFRAIYYLRKKYSYYKIKKVLSQKHSDEYSLDLHKMHFVLFNEDICFVIREDDRTHEILEKYFLLEEVYIPSMRYQGVIPATEPNKVYQVDTEFSMICIPYLVREIWNIASNSKIKNFENKMRVKFDDYQLSKIL